MSEIHDFDGTVIAVLSGDSEIRDAVAELGQAGYEVEEIAGEEGKQHLDPTGEQGPAATLKRLLTAFGDQHRVLERLHAELDRGNVVLSVEADPDDAAEVVRILQDNGGEFVWKFGTWTFTQIGE